MVRKNNPELKKSLNQFLSRHKEGTLLGNIFFKRYYKDMRWIKNPLSRESLEKFEQYRVWARKYGELYDIDWLLIGALAFQESGFDHSVRSRVGAVGLMQILPSTAADKQIAVGDIHLPENNIHAGVKYLALLRDLYFNDPEMDPVERIRFALAAYNAGPARMKRIRKLAAEMGYDPNRWFQHCEIAALRIVGRETVRYVRNINKYYVSYTLAVQEREKKQKKTN
jgi:membrane-bound lytic murein transglycosylase MltF